MLRDPKLKHHQQVKIEQVIAGRLPADVVTRIQASLKASGKSKKTRSDPKSRLGSVAPPAGQTSAAGEKPQHDPVPVLVAPYLVVPVKERSRSPEEEALALFWVPARLMPDGTLQSDPDHLPFVPRALLDPPIGERMERRPTPIALSRYTHPESDHKILLEQLNLTLPAQPPPRVSSRGRLLNQNYRDPRAPRH
jgi:hypothetical protein